MQVLERTFEAWTAYVRWLAKAHNVSRECMEHALHSEKSSPSPLHPMLCTARRAPQPPPPSIPPYADASSGSIRCDTPYDARCNA